MRHKIRFRSGKHAAGTSSGRRSITMFGAVLMSNRFPSASSRVLIPKSYIGFSKNGNSKTLLVSAHFRPLVGQGLLAFVTLRSRGQRGGYGRRGIPRENQRYNDMAVRSKTAAQSLSVLMLPQSRAL